MHTGKGQVLEMILEDGRRVMRIACPPSLIPSPGQYLLAGDGSDAPLPVPLFYTDSASQGFIHGTATLVSAAPVPEWWNPGLELHLRGPLGRGFSLPFSARKVALVAFDASIARLNGLIRQALKQEAAVVLVCDSAPDNLPDDVEVQPLSLLEDVFQWSDYTAMDVRRESLHELRERLGKLKQIGAGSEAQLLISTPVPCGGLAQCGVCAVYLKSDWKLACKDGPVFDWGEL
jgi:dihydroorotate dehydrogenase electron transfer subunit